MKITATKALQEIVVALEMAPTVKLLALATSTSVHFFRVPSLTALFTLTFLPHYGPIRCLAWSESAKLIAVGCEQELVAIISVQAREVVRTVCCSEIADKKHGNSEAFCAPFSYRSGAVTNVLWASAPLDASTGLRHTGAVCCKVPSLAPCSPQTEKSMILVDVAKEEWENNSRVELLLCICSNGLVSCVLSGLREVAAIQCPPKAKCSCCGADAPYFRDVVLDGRSGVLHGTMCNGKGGARLVSLETRIGDIVTVTSLLGLLIQEHSVAAFQVLHQLDRSWRAKVTTVLESLKLNEEKNMSLLIQMLLSPFVKVQPEECSAFVENITRLQDASSRASAQQNSILWIINQALEDLMHSTRVDTFTSGSSLLDWAFALAQLLESSTGKVERSRVQSEQATTNHRILYEFIDGVSEDHQNLRRLLQLLAGLTLRWKHKDPQQPSEDSNGNSQAGGQLEPLDSNDHSSLLGYLQALRNNGDKVSPLNKVLAVHSKVFHREAEWIVAAWDKSVELDVLALCNISSLTKWTSDEADLAPVHSKNETCVMHSIVSIEGVDALVTTTPSSGISRESWILKSGPTPLDVRRSTSTHDIVRLFSLRQEKCHCLVLVSNTNKDELSSSVELVLLDESCNISDKWGCDGRFLVKGIRSFSSNPTGPLWRSQLHFSANEEKGVAVLACGTRVVSIDLLENA